MGDRLGTPDAVGFHFFRFASFSSHGQVVTMAGECFFVFFFGIDSMYSMYTDPMHLPSVQVNLFPGPNGYVTFCKHFSFLLRRKRPVFSCLCLPSLEVDL